MSVGDGQCADGMRIISFCHCARFRELAVSPPNDRCIGIAAAIGRGEPMHDGGRRFG
jgi:hypothetical protein